jgi:uncharacterized protein (DUF488 family)
MTLYTIGFAAKSAEHFFTLLTSNSVKRVLDVRLNNTSQLAGFTKRDDLRFFLLQVASIDYTPLPQFAPSQELLRAYRTKTIDWEEYTCGYLSLLSQRNAIASTDPRLLAECLAAAVPGLRIVHLQ